ncbi:MAG: AraC family transcriptional regulator [Oceanospirillaceae bacterium]|nr:AraC family transcriptional regulator [Oceanospirillaceae bacterium]
MFESGFGQKYGRLSYPATNLERMPSSVSLELSRPNKALFVLLDNFSIASFTGSVDVLVTANLLTDSPVYEVVTCSLTGHNVKSDIGVDVAVQKRFDAIDREAFDLLVVCGGLRTPLVEIPALKALANKYLNEDKWVGSLWNGAYFFADDAAYARRSCAIHPDSLEAMMERYPRSKISRLPYVLDNRLFSCVGAASATRMMLELVEAMHGKALRKGINGILLTNSNRSINSALLNGVRYLPPSLETVIELMESNLEEPLEIGELSEYTNLSRRQVERLFSKYLDTSPSRYYLELRLNKGRQLLLNTNLPVGEVALACGFGSQTHFSHSFKSVYGASPTAFRSSAASDV